MTIRSICVYCGSSKGQDPSYIKAAENFGKLLAQKGIRLVYGGGSLGAMGAVARSVVENGGKVVGIIPVALTEVSGNSYGEIILVNTMHERKAKMVELSDAFVALPGGFGTLEELLETMTWNQLRIHNKPVGVLNINGYYDLLIKLFDNCHAEGFVDDNSRNIVVVGNDAEDILAKIMNYKDPFEDKDHILKDYMWQKKKHPEPSDI